MATESTTRRAVLVAVTVTAAAASARTVRAQPGLAPPAATPAVEQVAPVPAPLRFQVSAGGNLRITGLDGHAPGATDQLDDYGWVSARAPVMYGFGVDAQYLLAPLVDLGLAWQWSRGDHARGVTTDDVVGTDLTRLGAVARLHWAQGRPFVPEPRFEAGVVSERLVVHDQPDRRLLGYLRAGVDWRLGTRRAGAQLAVGYTVTSRVERGQLDPAVGGLDLSAGPYFRF